MTCERLHRCCPAVRGGMRLTIRRRSETRVVVLGKSAVYGYEPWKSRKAMLRMGRATAGVGKRRRCTSVSAPAGSMGGLHLLWQLRYATIPTGGPSLESATVTGESAGRAAGRERQRRCATQVQGLLASPYSTVQTTDMVKSGIPLVQRPARSLLEPSSQPASARVARVHVPHCPKRIACLASLYPFSSCVHTCVFHQVHVMKQAPCLAF